MLVRRHPRGLRRGKSGHRRRRGMIGTAVMPNDCRGCRSNPQRRCLSDPSVGGCNGYHQGYPFASGKGQICSGHPPRRHRSKLSDGLNTSAAVCKMQTSGDAEPSVEDVDDVEGSPKGFPQIPTFRHSLQTRFCKESEQQMVNLTFWRATDRRHRSEMSDGRACTLGSRKPPGSPSPCTRIRMGYPPTRIRRRKLSRR